MIKIIAIGKKHDKWIIQGVEEFSKRLKKPFNVNWKIIPNSNVSIIDKVKDEESNKIISNINSEDFVILLDEKGSNITSPILAEIFNNQFVLGKNIVIVIGGAFGVSEIVFKRANFILSFSKLVFPHQLIRLMIIEQIYRCQNILEGGKYHHL